MRNIFRGTLLSAVAALILVACNGENPGPLEGKWVVTHPFPVTVAFRPGELEARGMIKKVSYKVDGNEVLVTYEEGPTKGTTFRYTVIDADTIRSDSGTFHRVR